MAQLNVEKLFSELQANKIRPVYCLGGEEVFRKNLAVEKIKKIISPDEFNVSTFSIDKSNAGEILTLANTPPAFADRRLIIIKQAEKIKFDILKSFVEYLQNPLDTTCLIFMTAERKPANALLKACTEHAVKAIFYNLDESQASRWVNSVVEKNKFKADFDAVHLLIETAGMDLTALNNELDKIFTYLADDKNKTITKETVLNSLGFSKEENPFALASCLLEKNMKKSLSLTEKLLASGQEPMFLLNIIRNTAIKILKVKRMMRKNFTQEQIFAQAGLNRFFDRGFIEKTHNFKNENILVDALEKSLEIESLMKSSQLTDPKASIKSLIAKVLSGR